MIEAEHCDAIGSMEPDMSRTDLDRELEEFAAEMRSRNWKIGILGIVIGAVLIVPLVVLAAAVLIA